MQIYSKTDIGLVRPSNQDACRYGILSDNCVWAVVCDGMGGQNGGNIASKIAVETVSDILQESFREDMSSDELSELLVSAVNEANKLVYDTSCEDITLSGMGTTIELAFTNGNMMYIVHVGDSRAYLIKDNKIKQISTDHSVVQEMIDNGELTPEEAMSHPNKNLITRALGVTADIKMDFIEAEFEFGCKLLLATDGLTNYLDDRDIISIISSTEDNLVCEKLVETAKSAGGGDNITVALIVA